MASFLGVEVVKAGSVAIPDGMARTVRVNVELYGPVSDPQKYGVGIDDCKPFVVFKSSDKSPIGFALIDAAKESPTMHVEHVGATSPVEMVDSFDMPAVRKDGSYNVEGVRAAVKSLHDHGWTVVVDTDVAEALNVKML